MKSSEEQSSKQQTRKLGLIADAAQNAFQEMHSVWEEALKLSRQVVRNSANSIRAAHRGEFELARHLLNKVAELAKEMSRASVAHPAVYYAGYVEDAQKEFAEASSTLAFAEGTYLQGPEELEINYAPYLNGLAESVGELRRFIIDSLRKDDFSRCEELLQVMDDVYSILVSMDFPDAVTKGLRRRTDMSRGVLERTRADLTVALRQRSLEQKLAEFQQNLKSVR